MAASSPKLNLKTKNSVSNGNSANNMYANHIVINKKTLIPLPPPLLPNHIINNVANASSFSNSSNSSASSSSEQSSFPLIELKNNFKMHRNDLVAMVNILDECNENGDDQTPLTTEEEFKK